VRSADDGKERKEISILNDTVTVIPKERRGGREREAYGNPVKTPHLDVLVDGRTGDEGDERLDALGRDVDERLRLVRLDKL
jgi:hypothetical protein